MMRRVDDTTVEPALAKAREVRAMGQVRAFRHGPPSLLLELARFDVALYRHAMIEAGYVGATVAGEFEAFDPCPICGHVFDEAAASSSDSVPMVRSSLGPPQKEAPPSSNSMARPVRLAERRTKTLAAPDSTQGKGSVGRRSQMADAAACPITPLEAA